MARLEKILQRVFRCREFPARGGVEFGPQGGQYFRSQVLHAHHRRGIGDQGLQSFVAGCGSDEVATFGHGAKQGHIARGEITPPCPCGWQDAADLRRAEL